MQGCGGNCCRGNGTKERLRLDVCTDVWWCRGLRSCEGGGDIAAVDVTRLRLSEKKEVESGHYLRKRVFVDYIGGRLELGPWRAPEDCRTEVWW